MPPEPTPTPPPSYRRFILLGVVLLVLGVVAGVWLLASVGDSGIAVPSTEAQVLGAPEATATTTTTATTATIVATPTTRTSGVATTTTARATKDAGGFTIVRPAQLPKEAQQTLALVDKGGPYPYDRDGIEFQNREKILPKKAAGYYREYTVVTPGSSDRGERRIIAGTGGERYYTADHFESFVRVLAAS